MPVMILDSVGIYALALSSLLATVVAVTYTRPLLMRAQRATVLLVTKILCYTFVIRRYKWVGPWTVVAVLAQTTYIVANLIPLLLGVSSISEVALRAGKLSLVNLLPLYLSLQLGFLADLFGVSIRSFHQVHRSIGRTAFALSLVHVCLTVLQSEQRDIYALLSATSILLLTVLFVPILRTRLYETLLRAHQSLALFTAFAIYRHLLSVPHFSLIYIYIYVSVVCSINFLHFGMILYRNVGCGKPFPRAYITQQEWSISITVEMPRPLVIDAGQYINLWILAPKVSKLSWAQSHPFVVTSWLPKEQSSLELFVQPRSGLTSKLTQIKTNDVLDCVACISGPYGTAIPVWESKCVIMVAMDFGIAAMLPYLAKLVHGYRVFASRTRRIHIIWHVKRLKPFGTVLDLLNKYLDNDITLIKMLQISIYNDIGDQEGDLGSHGQVKYFIGAPDLKSIFEIEKNGDFSLTETINSLSQSPTRQRLSVQKQDSTSQNSFYFNNKTFLTNKAETENVLRNIQRFQADNSKILILMSGTGQLRDELRQLARKYLHQNVELQDLDYQL